MVLLCHQKDELAKCIHQHFAAHPGKSVRGFSKEKAGGAESHHQCVPQNKENSEHGEGGVEILCPGR